jgi:hypothetical protein
MTIDDLKKLDRKIRLIPDPFGRGFQTLKRTAIEAAKIYGLTEVKLAEEYMAWKWRK